MADDENMKEADQKRMQNKLLKRQAHEIEELDVEKEQYEKKCSFN